MNVKKRFPRVNICPHIRRSAQPPRSAAAFPFAIMNAMNPFTFRIALTAFLTLLWAALLVWACFQLPSSVRRLLRYEESRRFNPFIRAELYIEDYNKLRWEKLALALFYAIGFCVHLLSTAQIIRSALKHRDLPLHWLILHSVLAAALFFVSAASRRAVRHYYKRCTFFRETAVRPEELLEDTPDASGLRGEYYAWRLFQGLPEPKRSLINILAPNRHTGFSEIDLIHISRKGIFCIEAKNRHGLFMQNHDLDTRQQWVQVLPKTEQRRARIRTIQNPFQQNEKHIRMLQRFWRLDRRYFFNIVCFGEGAEIKRSAKRKSLRHLDPEGSLLFYDQRAKLYHLAQNMPDILGADLVNRLYRELAQVGKFSRNRREDLLKQRNELMDKRKQKGDAKRQEALRQALRQGRRAYAARSGAAMWRQDRRMQGCPSRPPRPDKRGRR